MEAVLLNSLAYRAEQMYWIHKKASVLLCEVSGVKDSLCDFKLVSDMLAALQDFTQYFLRARRMALSSSFRF